MSGSASPIAVSHHASTSAKLICESQDEENVMKDQEPPFGTHTQLTTLSSVLIVTLTFSMEAVAVHTSLLRSKGNRRRTCFVSCLKLLIEIAREPLQLCNTVS